MNKYTLLVAVAVLLSAACADSSEEEQPQVEPVERNTPMSKEERLAMRDELQEQKNLERITQDETAEATSRVTGEVPDDLLDKFYVDLEQRSGGDRSQFAVSKAVAAQWNDGSLGCPEPGQMYTQAIVNGYHAVIEYQGQSYDYRAADSGYFKLCPGHGLTR